jgi:hypothetical protein
VLAVRWTVGDASPRTVEALERSIASVHSEFDGAARIAICVHSVAVEAVREQLRSPAARRATWLDVERDLPVFVRRRVDASMAEGLAWRFAPLRIFGECCEVVLDAACELAPLAAGLWRWATSPGQRRCVVAAAPAPPGPGVALAIRGVPTSFDLEGALEAALARAPELLASRGDAVALELATVACGAPPIVLRAPPPSVRPTAALAVRPRDPSSRAAPPPCRSSASSRGSRSPGRRAAP